MSRYYPATFYISIFNVALATLISALFFDTYPFILEGYYMFFSGTLLCIVAAIYLLKSNNKSVGLNFTDLLFFVLVVYVLLQNALLNNTYADNNIDSLIFFSICYLLVKFGFNRLLKDESRSVQLFIYLFLSIALFQTLYGFFQLAGWLPNGYEGFNVGGSLYNPGVFAIYISTFAPFALGSFLFETNQDKFLKYFSLSVFVLIIILLPFTYSRTAIIAVLVGCSYVLNRKFNFIGSIRSIKIKVQYKIIFGLSVVLVSLASAYGVYMFKEASADGRILVWKISKQIIVDNPIFGVGFSNFHATYNKYQSAYFAQGLGSESEKILAGKVPYAFNDYLQIMIETGVIGFLLFIAVLVSLFILTSQKKVEANNKSEYLTLLSKGSLLTIIIAGLFAYPFQIIPQLALFFILIAIVSSGNNKLLWRFTLGRKLALLFAFILIVGWSLFTYKQIARYEACLNWFNANTASNGNDEKIAAIYYSKAYPVLRDYAYFDFNYASWLYKNKRYEESIYTLQRLVSHFNTIEVYLMLGDVHMDHKDYDNAEKAYQYCTNLQPSLFRPNYQLHKVYSLTGRTHDAILTAKKIISMKPKVFSPEVQQMKLEMNAYLMNNNIQ